MKNQPFKLIAIKPLDGLEEKYRKILVPGYPYHFYKNYEIRELFFDIDEIIVYPDAPPEIYDIGDIKVNISAIVGRNGSGKSSLAELLYVAIYNLSYQLNLLGDLKQKYESSVNVSIYYAIGASYYRLQLKNNQIRLGKFDDKLQLSGNGEPIHSIDQLSEFFYSVVINYSQYALNTDEFGLWLRSLFHKNDGYQSPIVLNPFRDRGTINITTENFLVRSRLLANILEGTAKSLSFNNNERVPRQLLFTFVKEKFNVNTNARKLIMENWKVLWKTLRPILVEHFGPFNRKISDRDIDQYAKKYILLKLDNIAKYSRYRKFKRYYTEEHRALMEPYIKKLSSDRSHVTFKLKQAINFLRFDTLPTEFGQFNSESVRPLPIEVSAIKKCIEDIHDAAPDIPAIELIPPAFLRTDIKFDAEYDFFHKLSSGEKQKIYALSSVIYHLKNLDSIKAEDSDPDSKEPLIKYKYINIIFDEVEMYYHPDLQRRFIRDMLDNIHVADFKTISAINFLFITHSPFILSDIPDANILYLDVIDHQTTEVSPQEQTFGGNLHDLLAKSFFLNKDGYMGEFANQTIKDCYQFLKSVIEGQNNSIGKQRAGTWSREKARDLIAMIGEPLVKSGLNQLYTLAFLQYAEDIDDEMEALRIRRENAPKRP
jgi:predicted ATPase